MRKFVLTKRARIDIDEIWDYLAADNIEAAERVLTRWKRRPSGSASLGPKCRIDICSSLAKS